MASSPTRANSAEHGEAAGHLRNVLGALAVAATDLLTEDAQADGYHPAEHAAIILAGTVDGLSQEDLQRRLGFAHSRGRPHRPRRRTPRSLRCQ